jgi:hypothetical protein
MTGTGSGAESGRVSSPAFEHVLPDPTLLPDTDTDPTEA